MNQELRREISEKMPSENMARLWAYLMVDALIQKGATHFYASPGMRNSPFLYALIKHPEAKLFMGMDERAQGFRALGHSKATLNASVLVCTSGSALSHYFPAVLEASKTGLPLVVLSADRPVTLSSSDANQTIDQKKLFSHHVRHFHDMGSPTPGLLAREVQALVAQVFNYALSADNPGPVHINAPFEEPLDQSSDAEKWGTLHENAMKDAQAWLQKGIPALQSLSARRILSEETMQKLQEQWEQAEKPLILIGELNSLEEKKAALKFCQESNTPIVLDVTSGIKFHLNLKDGISPAFDHPEVYDAYLKNPPDLIWHFGGRLTAKYYEKFLSQRPELTSVVFQNHTRTHNPALCYHQRVVCQLDEAFAMLTPLTSASEKGYPGAPWGSFVEKKSEMIDSASLAYPSVSKTLVENLRPEFQLYLGNSTVIRSFDSYASQKFKSQLLTYSHRGTSGIEGLMSASLGLCETLKQPTCVVLGDVAAYHDLNSFELLAQSNVPLLVIIVNNGGGGIFSLLPVSQQEELRPKLFTPHHLDFSKLASNFGLKSQRIAERQEWEQKLIEAQREVCESQKPQVLEVMVDDDVNTQIYQKLRTIKL
jgi:2-succinyl-5-enolpyruvyl-6-hydroxy-3-cyclohexene-1-carboxylate synthase